MKRLLSIHVAALVCLLAAFSLASADDWTSFRTQQAYFDDLDRLYPLELEDTGGNKYALYFIAAATATIDLAPITTENIGQVTVSLLGLGSSADDDEIVRYQSAEMGGYYYLSASSRDEAYSVASYGSIQAASFTVQGATEELSPLMPLVGDAVSSATNFYKMRISNFGSYQWNVEGTAMVGGSVVSNVTDLIVVYGMHKK